MARQFEIELRGTVVVELEDAVIDAVDDEWRREFYDFLTPEEIAEHIAYNLVVNHNVLSLLDGWADQPDAYACLIDGDWELEATEVVNAEETGSCG